MGIVNEPSNLKSETLSILALLTQSFGVVALAVTS